jgi:hypothetical protein
MGLRVVEKNGCIWICSGNRVLMFFDEDGSFSVKGDIRAFSIPPLHEEVP